jgi:D-alanyl-lipoteichoic acid acyltransferase DltB (MBOAT superfamily)
MKFNTLSFLVYFPIVVMLYFALPHRYRWALLLTASYYFYMCWEPAYALLLFTSTFVDYWAGLLMGKTKDKSKRRKYLYVSLLMNFSLLFFFKYFNFFSDSVRTAFDRFNIFLDVPYLNVLLPIGISFYTFQSVSYGIDVYRGVREPEKHLGIFMLYVSFFPQLVAGPIERSERLMPQFYEKHSFDQNYVREGLKLMLWGFFKKVVIWPRLWSRSMRILRMPAASP